MFLGVDVGTKNIKAIILDDQGRLVERASRGIYDLLATPGQDMVERDPLELWNRLAETLRSMKNVGEVEAVCVDATSGSFLALEDDRPLTRIVMYNDARAHRQAERLREISEAARRFEVYLPISPTLVVPKLMWLKENNPLFRRATSVLHESDYIVHRLSGVAVSSPNTAGKSHALLEGLGYLEEVYSDAGLDVGLMPRLRPIGAVVGEVSREAERETGIPAGTPVVNGMTDASCGDLTSGCLEPGQASATIGTSLTVHAVVSRVVPDPEARFYYKVYVGGRYIAGGFTNAGTPALDSLSRLTGLSLEELTRLASEVPPGSHGLISCTEWFGVRVPKPNPRVKGFILGLTEEGFTPGSLFRSFLEASSMALRLMLEAVEEVTGDKVREVRVSGGASRNDLFMQIIADVTGKPTAAVAEPESAVGSAMLAWAAVKGVDLGSVAGKVVSVRSRFTPREPVHESYSSLLRKYAAIVSMLGEAL